MSIARVKFLPWKKDWLAAVRAANKALSPEARAACGRARRGFDVPENKKAEYHFLTKTKRIPAREAGRMLGLVT